MFHEGKCNDEVESYKVKDGKQLQYVFANQGDVGTDLSKATGIFTADNDTKT